MAAIVRRLRRILLLVFLLALLPATLTHADTVTMGVRYRVPPYVMDNGREGLEMDIVRSALARQGHEVQVRLLSQARTFRAFEQGNLDAVLNVQEDTFAEAAVSDTVIHFQNYAIRLGDPPQGRNMVIADLADSRIVAFQNARHLLGEAFRRMADANSGYREIDRQILQVKLLFGNRVDYVVMDGRIFNYYRNVLASQAAAHAPGETYPIDYGQRVAMLPLFAPSPYRIAFREARLRDDFNTGLRELRTSGAYQQIFSRYQSQPDQSYAEGGADVERLPAPAGGAAGGQ